MRRLVKKKKKRKKERKEEGIKKRKTNKLIYTNSDIYDFVEY